MSNHNIYLLGKLKKMLTYFVATEEGEVWEVLKVGRRRLI